MLEHFKVPVDEAVHVQEAPLRETVASIFRKMGVSEADSELATDVLVMADMRGVETHGVSNMLRAYVGGYGSGELNNDPNWRITRETPATANVDSDRGLGIIVVPKAMEIAIEKARNVGVGMVTVHNSRHLGMASYHAMMALEHDQIGLCVTSCPPGVLPTFGAEPRLGTNPIALAAPADQEPPFVFDAATSTVAGNKLGLARQAREHTAPRLGRGPEWRANHGRGGPAGARLRGTSVLVPASGWRNPPSQARTRAMGSPASWTYSEGSSQAEVSALCRVGPISDTWSPLTTSRRSWIPPSSSERWTTSSGCCERLPPRRVTIACCSPVFQSRRRSSQSRTGHTVPP